jgi:hypothetical protein
VTRDDVQTCGIPRTRDSDDRRQMTCPDQHVRAQACSPPGPRQVLARSPGGQPAAVARRSRRPHDMDHELAGMPHQSLREAGTTLTQRRPADSASIGNQPGGADTTDSPPTAPKRRSQRCREPLAPPRSCPLYVRNHCDAEPCEWHLMQQGDTTSKRPASRDNRRPGAVSAGSGRCKVRTCVG